MRKTHRIQFFTKAECPLCDEARELLHRLENDFSMAVQEIDITSDPALFERYRTIIPVIVIDGRFTLGARMEEDDVRNCLTRS
jgi:glutaredoxin